MRLIAGCVGLLYATVLQAADVQVQEPKEFRVECHGVVTLSTENDVVGVGSDLEISVMYTGTSGFCRAENPFWKTEYVPPGKIGVFDEDSDFVGWLVCSTGSRPRAPETTTLVDGITIGRIFRINTATDTKVENVTGRPFVTVLGKGKYYLQAYLTEDFLEQIRRKGRKSAVAVSSPLRVVVTPRAGNKIVRHTSSMGLATITLPKRQIQAGERLAVQIRFTNNTGSELTVFNPFSSRRFGYFLGSEILISDANDRLLGGLMKSSWGSLPAGEDVFVTLPSGAIVGRTLTFGGGPEHMRFKADDGRVRIAPGDYYLRAAYTDRFFSDGRFETMQSYGAWRQAYDDRPVVVSDRVKVRITREQGILLAESPSKDVNR